MALAQEPSTQEIIRLGQQCFGQIFCGLRVPSRFPVFGKPAIYTTAINTDTRFWDGRPPEPWTRDATIWVSSPEMEHLWRTLGCRYVSWHLPHSSMILPSRCDSYMVPMSRTHTHHGLPALPLTSVFTYQIFWRAWTFLHPIKASDVGTAHCST